MGLRAMESENCYYKNDMPVYEIKSPENKENEIKRFLQAVDKFIEKQQKWLNI